MNCPVACLISDSKDEATLVKNVKLHYRAGNLKTLMTDDGK